MNFTIDYPLSTVGALIVAQDGEVLLVQSKKWLDHFSTPGGKIQWGETAIDALHREMWEETSLKIIQPKFALTQNCIFSPQFWEKRHFVMHDYIADLDPASCKNDVRLNHEAYSYLWIKPEEALNLNLSEPCKKLIQWYLLKAGNSKRMIGTIGVEGHEVECVVGVYPHERLRKQKLIIDIQLKYDFLLCSQSKNLNDTIDYVEVVQNCSDLANTHQYKLIETFAVDCVQMCLEKFGVLWAKVKIKKPAAIPSAHYAFVEYERFRNEE